MARAAHVPRAVPPAVAHATFALRGFVFFLLWVVLGRTDLADLAAGAVAALCAAWVSAVLLPPAALRLSWAGAARYTLRFLARSVAAGIDVARRVFDPRLPVTPGLVSVPTSLPEGGLTQAFCAVVSLQPGTVPLSRDTGTITLHCLDTAAPVAADLRAEEAAFRAALHAPGAPHG